MLCQLRTNKLVSLQNITLNIDEIIDLVLQKPYLKFKCKIVELVDLLDCPTHPAVQHPKITCDTACGTRSAREVAYKANHDVMAKKSSDSKKSKNKRARATYRERRRLSILNDAFRKLKEVVPSAHEQTRKADVLKMASQYIEDMTLMLKEYSHTEKQM